MTTCLTSALSTVIIILYWRGWYLFINSIYWIQHHHRSYPGTFIKATGRGRSGLVVLSRIIKASSTVIFHIMLVNSYRGCKLKQAEYFIISAHAVRGKNYSFICVKIHGSILVLCITLHVIHSVASPLFLCWTHVHTDEYTHRSHQGHHRTTPESQSQWSG